MPNLPPWSHRICISSIDLSTAWRDTAGTCLFSEISEHRRDLNSIWHHLRYTEESFGPKLVFLLLFEYKTDDINAHYYCRFFVSHIVRQVSHIVTKLSPNLWHELFVRGERFGYEHSQLFFDVLYFSSFSCWFLQVDVSPKCIVFHMETSLCYLNAAKFKARLMDHLMSFRMQDLEVGVNRFGHFRMSPMLWEASILYSYPRNMVGYFMDYFCDVTGHSSMLSLAGHPTCENSFEWV